MCSQMEEAESLNTRGEDGLLSLLVEAVRELKALRGLGDRRLNVVVEGGRGAQDGGGGKGGEEEDAGGGRPDEEECIRKVLHVLREVSISYSHRVGPWREALRECVCTLATPPPGGSHQPPAPTAGPGRERQDGFSDILFSVEEDVQNLTDKLGGIVAKLSEQSLQFHKEASNGQTGPSSEQPEDTSRLGPDHVTLCPSDPQPAPESNSRREERESAEDNGHADAGPQRRQREQLEGARERTKEGGLETVGLGRSGEPDVCFIRGPPGVADALRCDVADALSCLMVCGSEELLSRVIQIRVKDGARLRFPVTVVLPFCGSYRGSYREVVVKMVDKEGRRSSVAPLATEGTYGGQWGSFAEVRVYGLGLFAVVSCLKKENYTVPTKGLSLRLNMDPRIGLDYLPGCFAAPVVAQTMVQPMDTALLAAARSRTDAYHSVVSTSPVLYLLHPSSQPLRRPLAIILPCAPNLQRKKPEGQEESAEEPACRGQRALRRTLVSSVKTKVVSDELLVVLGSRDERWAVLDEVAARNLQKGLVTFELTESFDRLLVLRLLCPLQPCDLTSLAEELEEAAHRHAVTLVLQRRPEEPEAVLVAALPSRGLSWELTKLRAQGYSGLLEASTELSMGEGDQLILQFSGNITTKGFGENQSLTFHTQLQSRVLLHLQEVDPFGNYSSPHYKGTVIFYQVARERLKWRGEAPPLAAAELLDEPVCKLSLTLAKRPRTVHRLNRGRVRPCEEPDSLPDSLLLWLSAELSEEELSLLVPSLRLCRSAAQLVKLRAGDSPSAQAFHLLAMWQRGLPAASRRHRASQLARGLARIGRPDLAGELLLRQAEASGQKSEQPDLKAET